MKFNSNDPALWANYDPESDAAEQNYVDGKSETRVIRGKHARELAKHAHWQEGVQSFIEKRNGPEYEEYWAALRERIQEQARDPEYLVAVKQGCEKRSQSESWIQAHAAAMSTEEKRAKHSAAMTGEKHPNFQGYTYGYNEVTRHSVKFTGNKDMKTAGFQPSGVCMAIKHNKLYKGYRWWRNID